MADAGAKAKAEEGASSAAAELSSGKKAVIAAAAVGAAAAVVCIALAATGNFASGGSRSAPLRCEAPGAVRAHGSWWARG